MAKPRWWEILAALALLAILGALVLFPVFAGGGPSRVRNPCLSNVKRGGLALLIYASDADDRLPLRDRWMDATLPYTKTEALWHCPSVPKGAYGYAFNADLSALKQAKLDDLSSVPQIYDSVNPIRNASDRVASLPSPGRHRGLDTIGYTDGHAKMKRFGVSP